jgi:hypothetical protein
MRTEKQAGPLPKDPVLYDFKLQWIMSTKLSEIPQY